MPVDLARSVRERILDAAVDIAAETGYQTATPKNLAARAGTSVATVKRLFPDPDTFAVDTIDRLFTRRIKTYYANAALLDSKSPDPMPGLDALARQFPDPVWIAYWDILFAIRGKPAVQKKVQQITTNYDNQFVDVLPRFFPAGTPEGPLWFIILHNDAMGLIELTHAGDVPRAPQLGVLADLVTTSIATQGASA